MQRRTLLYLVIGIVTVGMLVTTLAVYAQDQPGGGFQGGGQRLGRPDRGMMMMRMGQSAIAVSGESLYVVYLGTLFKFNADTLEEEAQVRLRPEGMGGPGGGRPGGAPQ